MEQYSQYLKWMKRKHHYILNSWQEQAFAQDAYGPLIWPPRSYTCTFCKREFRSAQALSGHMNVHRRDRARLNDQSQVCSQTQVSSKENDYLSNSCEAVRVVHSIENSKTVACKNISTRREEYSRFFQGHDDNDSVETSLSVGLRFAVSRNRVAAISIDGDCNKRRKTEDVFPLPFWFKGCSDDHEKDNIDLELRLGDSPTVK